LSQKTEDDRVKPVDKPDLNRRVCLEQTYRNEKALSDVEEYLNKDTKWGE